MDGRDGAAVRSRAPRPPLLPVLAVAVALGVVAGAALAGPWRMAARDATVPTPTAPTTPLPTVTADIAPPPEPSEGGVPLTLVLAILGLLLLFLLLRTFLRRATLARGTTGPGYEPAPGTVAAGDAAEPEPDLPALRRGVDAARAVLAGRAAPDDAIIAAWLELEAAAASSGVPRAPSDTPTELTTAVLDATSADPVATRGLLHLYHRARFAPGAVMTADDVAAARACLERLAASWGER